MTHQAMQNADMQRCIDACKQCHDVCLRTAMTACLQAGGKHVAEAHLRLMINCQEICQTAANFMLSGSTYHGAVCNACAQVCDACADSCEPIGDMDDCVQACRDCAENCEKMAQTYQVHPGHVRSDSPRPSM